MRRSRSTQSGQVSSTSRLIRRGQAEGVFRADVPADLLASVLHHILHGAAGDVVAGRLDPVDAPGFVAEMALAVCVVPPGTPQR